MTLGQEEIWGHKWGNLLLTVQTVIGPEVPEVGGQSRGDRSGLES